MQYSNRELIEESTSSSNEGRSQDFYSEEAYRRAKRKVEKIMGFYKHLAVYLVVNIFLIIIVGMNSEYGFNHYSTYTTAFFWGIGLAFHFLQVFGRDVLFNEDWEEKKIREFIEKDNFREGY